LFENGKLTEHYAAGYAAMGSEKATEHTLFRTASIAKMVTALLVLRLQTCGKLSVQEDVSDFLGYPVRNPSHPDAPVTLGMLLSHTSSVVDSPAYFSSFASPVPLRQLLQQKRTQLPTDAAPTISIVVGSEGGFSGAEAQAAKNAGFLMAGLGRRILRTETASSFVLSALVYEFEL
jgi:CubicO group peptidase (beta-lactamase class C family)